MPKQQFPATGEALSTARLATIASLKTLLHTANVRSRPSQCVGCAEGSMKWRRKLERLNKERN